MVSPCQLIFDEDPVTRTNIPTQDVRPEGSDEPFLSFELELQPDRFPQSPEVLLLRQPWGEV